MPNKRIRRTDYQPLKLRAVSLSQGAQQPVASAAVTSTLDSKPVKILTAVAPTDGTRPGNPHTPASPAAQRPSPDGGTRRVYTSWQSSSRPSEPSQDDGVPRETLPATRYRFGAAMYDESAATALPPVPALARGQRDPVRTAIEVWRGIARFSRTLATPRATSAPDPAAAAGVPALGSAVPPATAGDAPAPGDAVPPATTRDED